MDFSHQQDAWETLKVILETIGNSAVERNEALWVCVSARFPNHVRSFRVTCTFAQQRRKNTEQLFTGRILYTSTCRSCTVIITDLEQWPLLYVPCCSLRWKRLHMDRCFRCQGMTQQLQDLLKNCSVPMTHRASYSRERFASRRREF